MEWRVAHLVEVIVGQERCREDVEWPLHASKATSAEERAGEKGANLFQREGDTERKKGVGDQSESRSSSPPVRLNVEIRRGEQRIILARKISFEDSEEDGECARRERSRSDC